MLCGSLPRGRLLTHALSAALCSPCRRHPVGGGGGAVGVCAGAVSERPAAGEAAPRHRQGLLGRAGPPRAQARPAAGRAAGPRGGAAHAARRRAAALPPQQQAQGVHAGGGRGCVQLLRAALSSRCTVCPCAQPRALSRPPPRSSQTSCCRGWRARATWCARWGGWATSCRTCRTRAASSTLLWQTWPPTCATACASASWRSC